MAQYVRAQKELQSQLAMYAPHTPLPEAVSVSPAGPLRGRMEVPRSKSLAQRILWAGALGKGTTQVEGLQPLEVGEDVAATLALLSALGTVAGPSVEGMLSVHGRNGRLMSHTRQSELDLGESGTLARMALGVLGLGGPLEGDQSILLQARGTLLGRSSPALVNALQRAGALVDSPGGAKWPLRIRPALCPAQLTLRDPASSQEVSALLFALAARAGGGRLEVQGKIPSAPYVAMSRHVLEVFGVRVVQDANGFDVSGSLAAPQAPARVEPDASAAAVAWALGCASGGEVSVGGFGTDSVQGDLRVLEYLVSLGSRVDRTESAWRVLGFPSRVCSFDLSGEPDLAPCLIPLAALACDSHCEVARFSGLGALVGKESHRIDVLAGALERTGRGVRSGSDWLEVFCQSSSQQSLPGSIDLNPRGDHRMAFAFALLGVGLTRVRILDAGCVRKSWPMFWDQLRTLGGRVSW